ncbi:MAG: DUF3299 domain-containing protein [Thiotrichales bacterium]|nr:DUF3299 domain-containing protein [Thiotrichales bacterium]
MRCLTRFVGYLLLLVSFPLLAADNAKPIKWSDLIPPGYDPKTLLKKYEKDIMRINELPDNSKEGLAILQKIEAELANAPVNPKLDGKKVKLAGYIAPIDIKNGLITRFLLVPYFGACIHVPPPPVNQTVMVEAAKGQGVRMHQVDYAFEVTGVLSLQHFKTDMGDAGYLLKNAHLKLYKDDVWLR